MNRNRCVYKDKCIRNLGECLKAKVNHWYEQNTDTSTSAAADGVKGNTTVDRATCLCILCSIAYGQVEGSRDGGISDTRGSLMAVEALSVVSLMAVSLLRLRETAQLHVQIAASELPMVRTVAVASLKLVMTAVVLRVAVVSMTLLKL